MSPEFSLKRRVWLWLERCTWANHWSMLCKFEVLDDLLCFVHLQTTSLLWSIRSYNRKSIASLTAIEPGWEEEEEDEDGGEGKGKTPGQDRPWHQQETSLIQLAMSWSPRLDLCFLSAVTSKWPGLKTQTTLSSPRWVWVCRKHPEVIEKDDLSSYFLIRVLSVKPKLTHTPESIEQWVWADKRWAETQQ